MVPIERAAFLRFLRDRLKVFEATRAPPSEIKSILLVVVSNGAVDLLIRGQALKTILVDGEDLIHVLEGNLTFSEMVDKKVSAAQSSGKIYIPVTGKSKI